MKHMRIEVLVPNLPYSPYRDLRDRLIKLCCGLTEVPMVGHYRPKDAVNTDTESGYILTGFLEDTDVNRDIVESLCITYMQDGQQEAVLLVINCNEVSIINRKG